MKFELAWISIWRSRPLPEFTNLWATPGRTTTICPVPAFSVTEPTVKVVWAVALDDHVVSFDVCSWVRPSPSAAPQGGAWLLLQRSEECELNPFRS